jgi:uncharacterized protein YnzC (UPF0291/DUF896 family)
MNQEVVELQKELNDERIKLVEAHQRQQLAHMAVDRAGADVTRHQLRIDQLKLAIHTAQEADEPEL